MYTVDYFINKFEAIPEKDWIVGIFMDHHGRCCAQGHCIFNRGYYDPMEVIIQRATPTSEVYSLISLFGFRKVGIDEHIIIALINNGDDPRYQQPTPKQRVLAALYDLKAKEEQELSDVTIEELIGEEELA